MAQEGSIMDETQDTEVKTQQPTGPLGTRESRSVLKAVPAVAPLAIASQELTLALSRRSSEMRATSAQVRPPLEAKVQVPKGRPLLLRVSGSEAAGFLRIWKVPKPKRKPGRPGLEEERALVEDPSRGAELAQALCPPRWPGKVSRGRSRARLER